MNQKEQAKNILSTIEGILKFIDEGSFKNGSLSNSEPMVSFEFIESKPNERTRLHLLFNPKTFDIPLSNHERDVELYPHSHYGDSNSMILVGDVTNNYYDLIHVQDDINENQILNSFIVSRSVDECEGFSKSFSVSKKVMPKLLHSIDSKKSDIIKFPKDVIHTATTTEFAITLFTTCFCDNINTSITTDKKEVLVVNKRELSLEENERVMDFIKSKLIEELESLMSIL